MSSSRQSGTEDSPSQPGFISPKNKSAAIAKVPYWYHSIAVGDGIVTPGRWSHQRLIEKFESFELPDLSDKSVVDIGAWDGFNAFEAERRGARRVVAMDRFVWSMQLSQRQHRARFAEFAVDTSVPNYYKPGTMPGKAAFDAAHYCLQSNVEQHIDDIDTLRVEDLGSFDISMFIGVLYHLSDPLGALRKLAILTRQMTVIETVGIDIPSMADGAYAEFFSHNQLVNDPTNWWAVNEKALIGMCLAAGFRDARIVAKSPGQAAIAPGKPDYVRFVAHAWH